jgi:hypothetical protein
LGTEVFKGFDNIGNILFVNASREQKIESVDEDHEEE